MLHVPRRCNQVADVLFNKNDVIETLRSTDSIKICAERLRAECKQFDFKLDSTLNKPNDLKLSLEHYQHNRAEALTLFLQTLCPSGKKSKNIQRKTDNIYQIAFNLVNDGLKKTPLHVASLSETIHDIANLRD